MRSARRGRYVIGGPWREPSVNALCLSGNIPATETATLYKETKIVLNIFRTTHHYNQRRTHAVSLNPRVYEAGECGALVISEHRPELNPICPEMPVFETTEELVNILEGLLADPASLERLRRRRLAAHTYARRLSTVLNITLGTQERSAPRIQMSFATDSLQLPEAMPPAIVNSKSLPEALASSWELHGRVTNVAVDGSIVLSKAMDEGAGTEQGLAGKLSYRNVALSFEVFLEEDACFVAKIHQGSGTNQLSNSYHLMRCEARGYIARHNHVLGSVTLPGAAWVPAKFACHDGIIAVHLNGKIACRTRDVKLTEGYCFLGIKGGTVRLRNIKTEIATPEDVSPDACPPYQILYDVRSKIKPPLSIITTVYDRARCLEHCLRTVRALHFQDYEQNADTQRRALAAHQPPYFHLPSG